MVLNGSEKGARSIQGWGAETKIHFKNTNSTRLESTETSNDTNIWNVTVPHPDGSGDSISLYDRYLIITKQDKAPIVAKEPVAIKAPVQKTGQVKFRYSKELNSSVDNAGEIIVAKTKQAKEALNTFRKNVGELKSQTLLNVNTTTNKNVSKPVDSILAPQTSDETVENITPSLKKNRKIRDIQLIQPDFSVEDSPISDEEIALRGLSRQEYNKLSPKEANFLNSAIVKSRKDRLKQLQTSIQSQ